MKKIVLSFVLILTLLLSFAACELENSIIVWIPVGTTDAYQNAVIEDLNLPSKFAEGTP